MRNSHLVGTVLAICVLATIACGNDQEPGSSDQDRTTAPQSFQVIARGLSFTPGTLAVEAVQAFEVVFKNSDDLRHTFTMNEFNVDDEVSPGVEATFIVIPTEAGRFTYYCRFHQEQGMVGALTVSSPDGTPPSTPMVTPTADSTGGY